MRRVTERIAGLYGIADADASDGDPERLAAALLAGGCRVIQLRAKHWSADATLAAARAIGERCRAVGACFIVNDDPALAVAADADGCHLGQTDGDPAAARRLLGDRILGRSTHEPEHIAAALVVADYLAFGPVFDTPNLSRPKPVRGLERLRAARALVPPAVPLVAIGGITAENLASVRAAGADSWAVINAIARAPDRVAATRALA